MKFQNILLQLSVLANSNHEFVFNQYKIYVKPIKFNYRLKDYLTGLRELKLNFFPDKMENNFK